MIALRFKRRLQPPRQPCLVCIRQIHALFQPRQQFVRGLRLRQAAVKGIPEVDLIQAQDIVERGRYPVGAVFAILKNRKVGR